MRLQGPTEGSDAQIPLILRGPGSAFYLSESPPGSKTLFSVKVCRRRESSGGLQR